MKQKKIISIVFILSMLLLWNNTQARTGLKVHLSAKEKFGLRILKKMLIPYEIFKAYRNIQASRIPHPENGLTELEEAVFPNRLDWRDYGIISPIKFQGNGACWVFSAISVIESQIRKFAGGNVDLSEKEISCCHPLGERGGTAFLGLAYVLENGIVTEDRYPWNNILGQDCNVPSPPDYYLNDYGVFYLGFKPLEERINSIKSILMTRGPVCTGFTVYEDFPYYNGGVYIWDGHSEIIGGHAVDLIGWQDDPSITNGGYWICKNSWGEDWGEDGFFNIGYGQCGIDEMIAWAFWDPSQTSPVFKIKVGIRYAGVGHRIELDVSARSNHGATISYSAENLPAGADYDSTTGLFTWIPSPGQEGAHAITFIADDGCEQAHQKGTFIIKNYNDAD